MCLPGETLGHRRQELSSGALNHGRIGFWVFVVVVDLFFLFLIFGFVLLLVGFFFFFFCSTLQEAGAASPVSWSLWWISAEEAFVPANKEPPGRGGSCCGQGHFHGAGCCLGFIFFLI